MDIKKAFRNAFNRKKEKGWDKIYVIVDIHDTILHACYENEETFDYLPNAKEALQKLSQREDICLILWTSCHKQQIENYMTNFANDGIFFNYANENPEVEDTSISNFSDKLYFNVGIDDKFGFDGDSDWINVIEALEEVF